MHWEDDRDLFGEMFEHLYDRYQIVRLDQAWTVKRHEQIVPFLHSEMIPDLGLLGQWKVANQRINHRVSHHPHAVCVDSLGCKILYGAPRVNEAEVCDVVSHDAVDLFR